ncbi:hypothetical protein [Marinoscillum sp.]|uniref:hypothetical protein n=1 Tax=Marinoscillum sp. TaxID=2024838 RepID=UPI003BAC76CF
MSEFKSFEGGIETNAIQPFLVGSMSKDSRLSILKNHGLEYKDDPNQFYDLQKFLNAFEEVKDQFGEMNLFLIGKAVIDNAQFPPMNSLEEALQSLDVAYHMNHRKGGQPMFNPENGQMLEGIGHYKLTKYDASAKTAEMVCHTPYPSKFEEGLILQIVRRFKPEGSIRTKVELDESKETRRKGAETCTFKISW